MYTDGLELKQEDMSTHSADYMPMHIQLFMGYK